MIPALVAALAGVALAGEAPTGPAAAPCRDARAIDWANHAHPLVLADRLVSGAAEVRIHAEDRPLPDVYRWTLRGVYYGDLDGDGCDEALTWLAHTYEAAGTPRGGPAGGQGFVWRVDAAGETLLGRIYGSEAATPRFEGAGIVVGAVRWVYTAGKGFEPYPYAVPGAPTSGAPASGAPSATPRPPRAPCRDLRAVDWTNHAFPFGGPDALRDGHAEYREYAALGGPHDTNTWTLRDVLYGDLDGDACDEAVVVIRASYTSPTGTSRAWDEAWVWRGTPSGEVSVGHVDAEEGAVVRVTGGRLHVDDDRWRLRGGRLVED